MACDFSVAQDLARVRPGRAAARLGARRRQHRLPAALRRRSRPRWRAARSASTGARTRRTGSACSRRVVPALEVDGRFVPNPLVVDRSLDRRRRSIVYGEFKTGAERERGQALLDARRGRSLAARSRGGRRSSSSSRTRCRAACRRRSRACASTSSSTGTATARPTARGWPQHDDRGARRLPRVPRRHKACREADFLLLRRRLAEGADWGEALIDEMLGARTHGKVARMTVRPLARARSCAAVVRIDAIHTGAAQPAYWKRIFREVPRRRPAIACASASPRDATGALAGYPVRRCPRLRVRVGAVRLDPRSRRRSAPRAPRRRHRRSLAEACRRFRAAGVPTIRTMVRRNDVPVLTFFRIERLCRRPVRAARALDTRAPRLSADGGSDGRCRSRHVSSAR